MTSPFPSVAAYWCLLRDNRNFRRLWLAQIVSELGDWFYVVAIYSLLLQFTGKAQAVVWRWCCKCCRRLSSGPPRAW
jgi:NTP pyrophosphatase (non-canonical NTP hydrolase)